MNVALKARVTTSMYDVDARCRKSLHRGFYMSDHLKFIKEAFGEFNKSNMK